MIRMVSPPAGVVSQAATRRRRQAVRQGMTAPVVTADPYQAARASATRLAELTGKPRHDVAVVLGSGWAPAAGHSATPRPVTSKGPSSWPGQPASRIASSRAGLTATATARSPTRREDY